MKIVIGQTEDGKLFVLPADLVTSTLVVYGGKGMGKTNLGGVLVEQLSANGLRWCGIDPLGVWWGLRHSADGKGPGIECLLLGGAHGDMPIEPTGAGVVADLVVDETVSVVIDISRKPSGEMWSIGEKVRFITDYAYRLFQRQGELVNGRRREPIFQILDEAARYIPQMIPKSQSGEQLSLCLGAWNQLVEEGRNIGIGVGLLTQRSARMNKSVSELADALFSFRIVGPNSIAAITDWLGEHVPRSDVNRMVATIRSLKRGHCLIVSPGWLEFEGVVQINLRSTFDSSATPKPGERAKKVTGQGAQPDLAKYAERMRETVERVKLNDPKELRREISELKKQLGKKVPVGTKESQKVPKVDVPAIKQQLQAGFEKALASRDEDWMLAVRAYMLRVQKNVTEIGQKLVAATSAPFDPPEPPKINVKVLTGRKELSPIHQANSQEAAPPVAAPRFVKEVHEAFDRGYNKHEGALPKGEKAILRVAAQYPDGATKEQLTVMTGYKRSSRDTYIQRLREKGFITEPQGLVRATPEGVEALGSDHEPLPEGSALQEHWLSRLPKGEREILRLLIEKGGEVVTRESLSEATGYQRSSRDTYLQRLRARRLIEDVGPGQVKATPLLFE